MIYTEITAKKQKGKKQFAVLIDPDKISRAGIFSLIEESLIAGVDCFLVGGSLLISDTLNQCVSTIKENCDIPVILFPGSPMQISSKADAILFISLISGRNAEALIGQHVVAAPYIKRANLEVLSTGYILIDSGKPTTVSYMSNSFPIPNDKPEIAACTAMAGEMLGMKLIYLDAGSGGATPVNQELLSEVSKNISVPLIAGGGIKNGNDAYAACRAGADILVVGNAIEKDRSLLSEISDAVKSASMPLRQAEKIKQASGR